MSSIINSTTTSPGGLISTGDSANSLLIQTGDTTAITINSSQQVALTNPLGTASGGTGLSSVGTSGQVLSSNGSTLSWTTPSAGFSGSTTTSSATDITLTNTSTQVQYVSMTVTDKFVILPDATTLTTEGSTIFVIINNGQYPFHIKNSAGNIIYYNVVSGETQNLILVDNSTAAGTWANDEGTLNLYGGLQQVSSLTLNISTYNAPAVAMLSETQALIFYSPTSATLSVVLATISGTSVSYGTPSSLISSGGSGAYYTRALAFNSTTGIVYYRTSTSSVLRAITVSGSTLTVGTPVNLASSSAYDGYTSGLMTMLDSTTGFVVYGTSTPVTAVRAFTVSGTTITLGSATNVSTDASDSFAVTQINTGKVLFGYTSTGANYVRAATNSGTTLTLGTAFPLVTPLIDIVTSPGSTAKISTDAVTSIGNDYFYGSRTTTLTISGTTISNTFVNVPSNNSDYLYYSNVKYLSDGLQLSYGVYAYNKAFFSLFKGNSSVGSTSGARFNLGIYATPIPGNSGMVDVAGGNKGIVVGPYSGYLSCQIVGVL